MPAQYRAPKPMPTVPANAWPRVDDALLRTLPPVLRGVVRALGFGRARTFLELHGGTPVYMPKARSSKLELNQSEFARLREALAPHLSAAGFVCLPKADKLFMRARNEQMRQERHSHSVAELAKRYSLTTRQVQLVCGQPETDFHYGSSGAKAHIDQLDLDLD
jgi:hypothetical protein